MERRITFRDCYAALADNLFEAGNSRVRRVWRISHGGLVPFSLENVLTGEPLVLSETETICPVEVPAEDDEHGTVSFVGGENDDLGFSAPCLLCTLTFSYKRFAVQYEISIYPELPVLRCRMFFRGAAGLPVRSVPLLDAVTMKEKHCAWECISLRTVTDFHNDLVRKTDGLFYPSGETMLSGNILRIHRTLRGDGLAFVREAPSLEEQVRWPGHDFTISGNRVCACAAGFTDMDCKADEWVPLYGLALFLYEGGDPAFSLALRGYSESRHRFRPGFDGTVACNTWGNDSDGKNICQEFLEKDLRAARESGITHYQIDAGWDSRETDPRTGRIFWKPNISVLPLGFGPFRTLAERLDATPGIWFEPYTDDGHQYGCYRQDAATLAELYNKGGFRFFKLDGFRLPDYTTTYRFEKMMRLVLENTGRAAFFNLDVTNWPRTGFFGATQYGSLFLENRYTDRLTYYPHLTLRNVWQLSRWFPTYRLQAEFLDTARNAELYAPGDGMAPSRCGTVYALATVLLASPLAWMEPNRLDAATRRDIHDLLTATADARAEAARSPVLPIGGEPDGHAFTGFQVLCGENRGYLLLFREASEESGFQYRLHGGAGPGCRFTRVASNFECRISACAEGVCVSFGKPFAFAFYQYEKGEGEV